MHEKSTKRSLKLKNFTLRKVDTLRLITYEDNKSVLQQPKRKHAGLMFVIIRHAHSRCQEWGMASRVRRCSLGHAALTLTPKLNYASCTQTAKLHSAIFKL